MSRTAAMVVPQLRQGMLPGVEWISVGAGDFGKKYVLLDGVRGASNRTIDETKVKAYGAQLDEICAGLPITLISHNGKFHIADGQHRIKAISDFAKEPRQLKAVILTIKDAEQIWGSLVECVRKLNNNKPMGLLGKLELYKRISPWVRAFGEDAENHFSFVRARSKVKWTTLMRAVSAYQRSILKNGLVFVTPLKEEEVVKLFVEPSQELVEDVVARMRPWLRLCDKAYNDLRMSQFTAETPLILWLLVSRLNEQKTGFKGLPMRLLEYPQIKGLSYWDRNLPFAQELLAAMNYKKKPGNLVSVFGETGRDA